MAYMSSAKLTIYGLEELATGGLKIASSTDEIKEDSGSGNFYLYDTRGVLSFGRPTKNVDGSWSVRQPLIRTVPFYVGSLEVSVHNPPVSGSIVQGRQLGEQIRMEVPMNMDFL